MRLLRWTRLQVDLERGRDIPPEARALARHCLLSWGYDQLSILSDDPRVCTSQELLYGEMRHRGHAASLARQTCNQLESRVLPLAALAWLVWRAGVFERGAQRLAAEAAGRVAEGLPPYPYVPATAPGVLSRLEDETEDAATLVAQAAILTQGLRGRALADALGVQAEMLLGKVRATVQGLSREHAEVGRLAQSLGQAASRHGPPTPYDLHLSAHQRTRKRHEAAMEAAVEVMQVTSAAINAVDVRDGRSPAGLLLACPSSCQCISIVTTQVEVQVARAAQAFFAWVDGALAAGPARVPASPADGASASAATEAPLPPLPAMRDSSAGRRLTAHREAALRMLEQAAVGLRGLGPAAADGTNAMGHTSSTASLVAAAAQRLSEDRAGEGMPRRDGTPEVHMMEGEFRLQEAGAPWHPHDGWAGDPPLRMVSWGGVRAPGQDAERVAARVGALDDAVGLLTRHVVEASRVLAKAKARNRSRALQAAAQLSDEVRVSHV